MILLSQFENHDRQSLIYQIDKDFLVVYREGSDVFAEKTFMREWEAEISAENFVNGHIF
jgi:hypothetical protein